MRLPWRRSTTSSTTSCWIKLSDLPGLTSRAMFGGYGRYQHETFFGIIHKGRLYVKVIETTVARYKAQGMKPFRPNVKQTLKSFHEVPVDAIENAEELTNWAVLAEQPSNR